MTAEAQPTSASTSERASRKVLQGRVLSAKMAKTIVVQAERLVRHPKYGKYMRRYSRFYAHDEKGEARRGDLVEIMETRPLSRLKRWRLVNVVERSDRPDESFSPIEASKEVKASTTSEAAKAPARGAKSSAGSKSSGKK